MTTEASLFVCDQEAPSDVAIVFGASDESELRHRTAKACDLFHAGLVPHLILSGDARNRHASGHPEAWRMADIALATGVPHDRLHREDRSNNTVENVRQCLQLVNHSQTLLCKTVALVSSAWHMYRVLMICEHFFPSSTRFRCLPTFEGCNRDNWMDSAAGRKRVANELRLVAKLIEVEVQLPRRFQGEGRGMRGRGMLDD